MRLAMKLVESFAQTMPLPRVSSPNRAMRARTPGSVSGPATSSSSFM